MEILKKKSLFTVLFMLLLPLASFASEVDNNSDSFDWETVLNAIIEVESSGNPNAKSGVSCGVLQITPILVADCNQILKRRKSNKRYKLSDRFNVAKSKEMFILIQSYYNPKNNIERAIRLWNGGVNYSVKRTQRYYEKVMRLMK